VTAAAAGWYHDPSDSGSWRWWDGATWTSHVRPRAETAPVSIAYPVSEAITLPVQYTAPLQAVPAPQTVTQPVAEAEPVVAQQPVIPQLPQPAQPIQPIQPVSLTPETPASEQEYWHSPNAEIVHIPGRSATSQHGHASGVGPGGHGLAPYDMHHQWGDVGSPQTAGIWLLASIPLMSLAIQVAFGFVAGIIQGTTGVSLAPPNIVFYVVVLVLEWTFAAMDVKALAARGYRAPKIWWMLLLPPLAYFIVRGRVVRREGQRAWPPELLYFLSILGLVLISVALVVFVMTMMGGVIPTQLG
jgi:hypothetical protein